MKKLIRRFAAARCSSVRALAGRKTETIKVFRLALAAALRAGADRRLRSETVKGVSASAFGT